MNYKEYKRFNYWFKYIGESNDGPLFLIYDKKYDKLAMYDHPFTEKQIEDSIELSFILDDWESFKRRPEYALSTNIHTFDKNNVDWESIYISMLTGCALVRALNNNIGDPDEALPKIDNMVNWLRNSDFFQSPASTQYHESIPGGLCIHSLKVVDKIKDMHMCRTFNNVAIENAILVALVHDWCKIGMYSQYIRNVKDDETGQWKQVPSYRVKPKPMMSFGHGVSSMYLASRFINLSHDEALAIRWHQGRWNVCREELNELQQSNENHQLVHMLQFADQLAITRY